jgi:hypothetical protein
MSSRIPNEIAKHRLSWLLKPIYRRVHFQNKMFSACIVAEPGSGKSYCAIDFAWLLDRGENDKPRFSMDRVCFSASQFAEVISKDWPKGTAIIMDDAGLNLYSREAMNRTVRQIAKVFQSCRYKNLVVFLTLPTLAMLDKTVRTLLNAYIEPVEIIADIEKVRAKFHFVETNPKTGKIYYNRPEMRSYVLHPCGRSLLSLRKVDSVLIDKPPMDLVDDYEKQKKLYLDEWNRQNVEKIRGFESTKKRNVTIFETYYKLVLNDVKKYITMTPKGERVDASMILLYHPEVGSGTAYTLAKTVNTALKGKTLLVKAKDLV